MHSDRTDERGRRLVVRRDRQIARHTKAAGCRDRNSLDEFDFEFNRSVRKKTVLEPAVGDFVRKGRDAILVAPPSVGKSHHGLLPQYLRLRA